MRVVVVTPPAGDLLDPVVVKDQFLKVDSDDDDALIDSLIAAAIGNLDGPDGWLGRCLAEQTLELRIDCFPERGLALPCPPLIEIDTIKYVDRDGVEQTLDDTIYTLRGSVLHCAYGQRWPSHRREPEAVRITYQAGYETLPPAIGAALMLMIGDLYANRETTVPSANAIEVPMSTTVTNLLAPFRVW